MKKIASLFFIVTLTLGVLAACGPDNNSEGESGQKQNNASNSEKQAENSKENTDAPKPDELVVWGDEEKEDALKPAVQSFEKKHDIDIKLKTFAIIDIKKKLRLDGPAGTGPDVLTLPHDQIGEIAKQGLINPLDVDSSVTDIYTESSIKAETYKEELYGLPKSVETPVLFYNKKHMDKVPDTFEGLRDFAKDFTKDDQYGFVFNGNDFFYSNAFSSGFGGYLFKDNNGTLDPKDLGINNKGAIKGAKWIADWYNDGLIPEGIVGENAHSELNSLWEREKLAAKIDSAATFSGSEDAGIDFGVAPLPELPNGEYPKTFVNVKGWHVSSYSEHEEWAQKLTTWLANKENAKIRYEQTEAIPSVESLANSPLIEDNPKARAVFTQAKRGEPTPNIPEMGQVWETMNDKLQLIITEKQDAKSALDDAEDTIQMKIEQLDAD